MTVAFGESNRSYIPYQKPAWMLEEDTKLRLESFMEDVVARGYITSEEQLAAQGILDYFADLVYYTNQVDTELNDQSRARDNKVLVAQYNGVSGVFVNQEGVAQYLCYRPKHIEALVQLFMYDLIEADDPLIELNGLATRSDFLRGYITVLGYEKEALNYVGSHPFSNVPEESQPYVTFAYNKGWLEDYKDVLAWDESLIDPSFCGKVAFRALGGSLDMDSLARDPNTYDIDMYSRLGASFNQFKNRTVLQQGEPLRKGDIVAMMVMAMDRHYNESYHRVKGHLLDHNMITQEVVDYLNGVAFFEKGNRYNQVLDVAMKMYFYSREHFNVYTTLKWDAPRFFDGETAADTLGLITVEMGRDSSVEEGTQRAIQVLQGFGVSRSSATKAVEKAIYNGQNSIREGRIKVSGSHSTRFEISYNNGFKTLWVYVLNSKYDRYYEGNDNEIPVVPVGVPMNTATIAQPQVEPQVEDQPEPEAEKKVTYAGIGYAKSLMSGGPTARYFNVYGLDMRKTIQMEDKLSLSANTDIDHQSLGSTPKILAAYDDGRIIKNTTDSEHYFKIRVTNAQNEEARGGIIFAAENEPFPDGLKAMGISINPSTKKIIVEKFDSLSYPIRSFDLPSNSDVEAGVEVRAAIFPLGDKIVMNLFVDSQPVVSSMVIGSPNELPAKTGFGFYSNNADIEFDYCRHHGSMTTPRE
jgi:hypothetical protein